MQDPSGNKTAGREVSKDYRGFRIHVQVTVADRIQNPGHLKGIRVKWTVHRSGGSASAPDSFGVVVGTFDSIVQAGEFALQRSKDWIDERCDSNAGKHRHSVAT